jgi:hypothetical protein
MPFFTHLTFDRLYLYANYERKTFSKLKIIISPILTWAVDISYVAENSAYIQSCAPTTWAAKAGAVHAPYGLVTMTWNTSTWSTYIPLCYEICTVSSVIYPFSPCISVGLKKACQLVCQKGCIEIIVTHAWLFHKMLSIYIYQLISFFRVTRPISQVYRYVKTRQRYSTT